MDEIGMDDSVDK